MSIDFNNEYVKRFINTEYENEEEMIVALCFCMRLVYFGPKEVAEILKIKHAKITEEEFSCRFIEIRNAGNRAQEYYFDKIKDLSFTRRVVRGLNERYGNRIQQISKGEQKDIVSSVLLDVLSAMRNSLWEECYTKERLDLLIKVISQQEYLKNEFEEGLNRFVKDFLDTNHDDFVEYYEQSDFETLLIYSIADYLIAFEKQDDNLLLETKKKANNVIKYNEEEIKNSILPYHEQEAQYRQEAENTYEDLLSLHMATEKAQKRSTLKEIVKEQHLRVKECWKSDEEIEKDLDEFVKKNEDTIIDFEMLELKEKYYSIMNSKYRKHFQYEEEYDEKNYEQHYESVVFPIIQSTENYELNVVFCIMAYLQDIIEEYCNFHNIEEEVEDSIAAAYVFNFLVILASGLLYGLNEEEKIKMVEDFYTILNADETCKNNFHDCKVTIDLLSCSAFSPLELYYYRVIASVLAQMHQNPIARKIKNILAKYSKEMKKNINEVNKSHSKIYYSEQKEKLYLHVHEFALAFIYNFFLDPRFVASASPFVLYARLILSGTMRVIVRGLSDKYEILLNQAKENSEDEKFRKILWGSNFMDNFITQSLSQDWYSILKEEFDSIEIVTASFVDAGIDLFLHIKDFPNLLNKFRNNLKVTLIYMDEIQLTAFQEATIEQKIKRIWRWCVYYALIDEFKKMSEYMPNVESKVEKSYTFSLEESVSALKHSLEEKERNIALKDHENEKLKKSFKQFLDAKSHDVEEKYIKEIHKLNKLVQDKNQEIEALKENQLELYKLRELMFSLENKQEEVVFKESISNELERILKEKSVVLVGGHIKLIDKLKKRYPTLKWVSSESTVPVDLLVNADHIFLFYNFMNHSIYYKIMRIVSANPNINWDYIPYTNFEKSEALIYEKLFQIENN